MSALRCHFVAVKAVSAKDKILLFWTGNLWTQGRGGIALQLLPHGRTAPVHSLKQTEKTLLDPTRVFQIGPEGSPHRDRPSIDKTQDVTLPVACRGLDCIFRDPPGTVNPPTNPVQLSCRVLHPAQDHFSPVGHVDRDVMILCLQTQQLSPERAGKPRQEKR